MAHIENMRADLQVVEDIGDRVLAPGEQVIIQMHNRLGSLQVSLESTASYMVSVTQANRIKVENDTAVFIPVEREDLIESADFSISQGGFIKIENRASSAASITVDWRV